MHLLPGKREADLSAGQKKNVARYRQLVKARKLKKLHCSKLRLFHTNDNPFKRCVWSVARGRCPTLRHCMGPLWLDNDGRTVFPCELLQSMGWAASTKLPLGLNVTSLLGNSMHMASVHAVICVALSCCTLDQAPPEVSNPPGAVAPAEHSLINAYRQACLQKAGA